MIETDPPRHQHQRPVLSPEFTPRSVGRLSERGREVAGGCIERARDLGTFDFVAEVAQVIPATVTLELLGVPEEDWARLTELEPAVLNPLGKLRSSSCSSASARKRSRKPAVSEARSRR